jgi:hypothetical protein
VTLLRAFATLSEGDRTDQGERVTVRDPGAMAFPAHDASKRIGVATTVDSDQACGAAWL